MVDETLLSLPSLLEAFREAEEAIPRLGQLASYRDLIEAYIHILRGCPCGEILRIGRHPQCWQHLLAEHPQLISMVQPLS
jgi:hypothetical protein